jgi:CheY-like chemotaxis protein
MDLRPPFARLRRSPAGSRPRVLVADDHHRVLDAVSTMLAVHFDVAGLASDGTQAVDMVRRVHPDIIVLDVDMPGMDGFHTVRALQQDGLLTPVVFLSAHDADAIVTEAFRCGGRGYVRKSRIGRDLVSALDQALLGRLFVPSLTTLFTLAPTGGHAMQLHAGVASTLDGLAAFFDLALQRGDATCVIASERVREGLRERLAARGWDVAGPSGHPRHLVLDAGEALNRFMRNGLPDADRLAAIAAELDEYRRAVAEGAACRLTIFDDIVVSLAEAGNAKAVIELESQWNALTHALPFFTLCAYSTACFHEGMPQLWSDVCSEHGALTHAGDV